MHEQGRPFPMGQPGQSEQLAPPIHKNLIKKKAKPCNIVRATSLLNGGYIARLMSKATTNNICSNKHKV
jgi:hypothetical protein